MNGESDDEFVDTRFPGNRRCSVNKPVCAKDNKSKADRQQSLPASKKLIRL